MKTTTKNLTLCAFFAALTAICSQIAIPLPWDVPLNLATFSVMLAGAILGPWSGLVSQAAYLLLGAVGAPVFATFRGGLDRLVGPTGGYLIGYLFLAFLTGLILQKCGRKFYISVLAMAAGTIVCYFFGTAWYMISTHNSLFPALTFCVLPFLPGDAAKILLASFLTIQMKKRKAFSF